MRNLIRRLLQRVFNTILEELMSVQDKIDMLSVVVGDLSAVVDLAVEKMTEQKAMIEALIAAQAEIGNDAEELQGLADKITADIAELAASMLVPVEEVPVEEVPVEEVPVEEVPVEVVVEEVPVEVVEEVPAEVVVDGEVVVEGEVVVS